MGYLFSSLTSYDLARTVVVMTLRNPARMKQSQTALTAALDSCISLQPPREDEENVASYYRVYPRLNIRVRSWCGTKEE